MYKISTVCQFYYREPPLPSIDFITQLSGRLDSDWPDMIPDCVTVRFPMSLLKNPAKTSLGWLAGLSWFNLEVAGFSWS